MTERELVEKIEKALLRFLRDQRVSTTTDSLGNVSFDTGYFGVADAPDQEGKEVKEFRHGQKIVVYRVAEALAYEVIGSL